MLQVPDSQQIHVRVEELLDEVVMEDERLAAANAPLSRENLPPSPTGYRIHPEVAQNAISRV